MQRLGRGTTARPPPTHRRGTSTPRPRRGGRPTLERRWMARQATRQSSARRPAATGGPVGTTRRPTATGSCLCSARQDAKTNTDVRPTHWTRRRAGADTSRQRRNKGRRMPGTGDSGPREGRCRKSDTDCTHHSNAHHGRPLAANGRSTFGDTHHQLTCHNPIGRPPAVRGPCSRTIPTTGKRSSSPYAPQAPTAVRRLSRSSNIDERHQFDRREAAEGPGLQPPMSTSSSRQAMRPMRRGEDAQSTRCRTVTDERRSLRSDADSQPTRDRTTPDDERRAHHTGEEAHHERLTSTPTGGHGRINDAGRTAQHDLEGQPQQSRPRRLPQRLRPPQPQGDGPRATYERHQREDAQLTTTEGQTHHDRPASISHDRARHPRKRDPE